MKNQIKLAITLSLLLFFGNAIKSQDVKELDLDLANYEYPYEVNFLDLDVQNQSLSMAYMDVQPPNYNGRNVLLFHGKNFNGAYWGTTIKALANQGFRVIVPDQIGFGKSAKPEYFQYSFQQLALNTKMLLDTLGVKNTAVLGHSMGGMLATRFTLMFPEMADRLILENPIGLEDYKPIVPYKPVEWWYQNELKKDYQSIRLYMLESYYDGQWEPEYNEWVNILAGWTLNPDYEVIAWNSALTYDMIFTQPVVYEFKNIEAPTLLIIGTRDRTALGKPLVSPHVRKTMGLYDKLGKQTRDRIPNSELVELDDIGHLPHIEAFDRFIDPLIDFLEE